MHTPNVGLNVPDAGVKRKTNYMGLLAVSESSGKGVHHGFTSHSPVLTVK